MAKMVRKQVYIEPYQDQLLEGRARELGVSQAELVRRGIEAICRAPTAFRPDLKAWEEIKEFIRQHRWMDVPQTGRGWTREDIYEEMMNERFPQLPH